MTALTTSPFLTLPPGIASLTVATMVSPIPAYRRPDPPSTRMQRISFAPVLSATRSRDSCWITSLLPYLSHYVRPQLPLTRHAPLPCPSVGGRRPTDHDTCLRIRLACEVSR